MRLIDADAFSAFLKDVVIKQKYDRLSIDNALTVADVLQAVCADLNGAGLDGFKDAPTVDAVPVVRCKDCKHNPKIEWFGCPMASLSEKQRPETAWCWKGERKGR